MNVTVEGQEVVIRLPINETIEASESGKTWIVSSSHGNIPTMAKLKGRTLVVGATVYIRREKSEKDKTTF